MTKRYCKNFNILILSFSIMLSCSELLIEPDCSSDYLTVFKKFWDDMDKCYPFFDTKSEVYWDSVYNLGCTYFSPEREQMQTEESIFNFYDSIIENLYDPHMSIVFTGFQSLNYYSAYSWAKGQEPDNSNSGGYKYEQNISILHGTYFNELWSYWDERIWYAPVSDTVCYFTILNFDDYNFKKEKLDPLVNEITKCKVCIIDMRGCIGGMRDAAEELCSRLCTHDFIYGYKQCKNGYGHDSFKKPMAFKITTSNKKRYTGEIILLINRKTASAGELFALAMKESGNAKLIGDTTQGHFGSVMFRELSNGWYYTFPVDRVLDKNFRCLEDVGVTPNAYLENICIEADCDLLLDYVIGLYGGNL